MCGRFNATLDKSVRKLYTSLNINKVIDKPIDTRFVKAADTISIIRNSDGSRQVENALWWLLLEQTANGFKPSKYTSFNIRFDKLNTQGSAGYQAYHQSRCIVAVKGFGETEFVNKKHIHSKAMPLMLSTDSALIDRWLSQEVTDITQFEPLLSPHILQPLIAQQIDKPSSYQAIGKDELSKLNK